jgi:hypothetical protein
MLSDRPDDLNLAPRIRNKPTPPPKGRRFCFDQRSPLYKPETDIMSRVRIDPLSAWRAGDFAKRSGRTYIDAIGTLIGSGYKTLTGAQAAACAPALAGEELSDRESLRGRTVSSHMRPATIAGIERFADLEKRSFSNAIEALVRGGLRAHGLWPPTSAETVPANV